MVKRLRWALLVLLALLALIPTAALETHAQQTPLRVVTKPLVPFVYRENGALTGFSVELWDRIATELGLDYEWVEVATVTEQLDLVRDGGAEVAIAGISMTPEREAAVDFSHPMFAAGLQIMTRAEVDQSATALLRAIVSPGLLQILLIGLLVLLVMAHLIWLFEMFDGQVDDFPRAYLPGIWEGIWWSTGLLATGAYGNRPANSVARRVVSMFWMFLGIILIAQFTASVTSNLTIQRLQGSINGPSDLPGRRIATIAGSTSAQFLNDERLPFTGVEKIEDAYALLLKNDVQAIVFDSPVLLYYVANDGKGVVDVVGQVFKPEEYGIALQIGSPYRKTINETLLKLKQDGSY